MNTDSSSRTRNRWIAGGALLVMLIAGGSIGRLFYLQHQAALPSNDLQDRAAAIDARLALSPEAQARRLELVNHLRDTWKPWAEQHQTELRRMLASSPSDLTARDAVWNAIPNDPSALPKEIGTPINDALNPNGDKTKGEVFTWDPISRGLTPVYVGAMPADEKGRYDREQSALRWGLQNDFASHRDIALSQSMQSGRVSVTLWASGRVTEDTIILRKSSKSAIAAGAPNYNRKELSPPYDFLTANQSTAS